MKYLKNFTSSTSWCRVSTLSKEHKTHQQYNINLLYFIQKAPIEAKESNPQANHDSGGFSKWKPNVLKKKGSNL
jgi:hypothetical protein